MYGIFIQILTKRQVLEYVGLWRNFLSDLSNWILWRSDRKWRQNRIPDFKIKGLEQLLESLGISSILLNPIFESDNHGYDTRDYKKIDRRLGTNEDFAEVCKDLHAHNVKIVLDGVFNHVGRGCWAV